MKKKATARRKRAKKSPAVATPICSLCGCAAPHVKGHVHADWHEFVASTAKVVGELSHSAEIALNLSRRLQ